jgi:ribosomal-protein-alanine N-acetyltransferase
MDTIRSAQDVILSTTFADMTLPELPWQGNKTRLRHFEENDITPTYISWLNNPEVVRYSNQRFRVHTRESCRLYLESFNGDTSKFLAIEDCASGVMLGTITVYWSPHHHTADIGIMVGNADSWGSGIGFDAFNTVVGVLTNSGNVRKITAGTLAINNRMVRIIEKAGLIWEATRRNQELLDGKPVDIVYYAKFCDA